MGTSTSRTTWPATVPGRKPASFAVPESNTVHLPTVPTSKDLPGYSCQSCRAPTRGSPRGGEQLPLKNLGDCYKRHAARIGMVSVTNAVIFTRTLADTRVGAIEHPQTPYPRILMDWVASPLRETQTRPRPLQRKILTKNSLHREYFCRGG